MELVLRLPDRSYGMLFPLRPSSALLLILQDRLTAAGGDPWLNLACMRRDLERLL